jgi:hypothetical protein
MGEKNKVPNVRRQKKAAGPERVAADAVRRAAERQRDEMVEREFRLGQLSLAEVARRSGGYPPSPPLTRQGIGKRAEKGGWERSLLPAVQAKVKEKLLRDAAPEGATPSEAVDAAADRAVEIVREHRTSLARLKRITNKLMGTVELYLDNEIKVIPWLRAGDTIPSVVARLAQAQAKVCQLERQAFSVGAGAGEDDPSKRQGPALPDWRTLFERAGLRERSDPSAG